MSSDTAFSTDETFFSGVMTDTQTAPETERDEFVNSTVISSSQGSKKSKGRETLTKHKNLKTHSSNKENAGTKNTKEKKRGKDSADTERGVLKVLNENLQAKSPRAKPKSSPKKDILKMGPTPRKRKSGEKKASAPKIVIYQDSSCQETKCKQKVKRKVSRSLDGRRSAPEKKNPELVGSLRSKSVRRSVQDVRSSKSPNQQLKSPRLSKSPKSPKTGQKELLKLDSEMDSHLVKLETVFPNVDPDYLKAVFWKFKGSLATTIEHLLQKEKENDLPTKADYLKRLETEKQQKKYLEDFSVEDFLKMFPDPWEHFLKQKSQESMKYAEHSFHYLKIKFKKHYTQAIQAALNKNNNNLYKAYKDLKKNRSIKMRVTSRSKAECGKGPTTYSEQFMHEVAFIENETKIKSHIKKTETVKHKKFMEAKKAGALLECLSCNDPSLLLDDAVNCPANHVFCEDCVVKSVDAKLGKNNFHFKCLVKCEEIFSVESLQRVLTSEMKARIESKNQLEEIKAAGIKDLVWCPFCSYATVMPPEISVFSCLNPDCLRESCRHCKQLNHIPLKCRELEKLVFENGPGEEEEEENKSSGPILTCIQCNKEFLETNETNKLVCPCGATICSICRQPIPGCPHFKSEPSEHGPEDFLSDSTYCGVSDTTDDSKSQSSNESFAFNENLPDFQPGSFHSI